MLDTSAEDRLPALDLLRYIAVVAVVFDHATNRWMTAGRPEAAVTILNGLVQWNVPVLILISGYLAGLGVRAGSSANLSRRLRRILVPYVAWALFYQALLAARAWAAGDPIQLAKPVAYLFGGPVYHVLWYLPMLAYCTIVGSLARTRRARLVVLLVAVALRALSIAVFAERASPPYWLTVEGFLFAVPWYVALFVGAESWAAGDYGSWPRRSHAFYAAAFVAWLGVGIVYPFVVTHSEVHIRAVQRAASALVAGGALIFAVREPSRLPVLPKTIASTSLGVYVMHMSVLVPVSAWLKAAELPWWAGVVLTTVVAAGVSTVVAALLARVPLFRPLVT